LAKRGAEKAIAKRLKVATSMDLKGLQRMSISKFAAKIGIKPLKKRNFQRKL
jgi:hypothetical protein